MKLARELVYGFFDSFCALDVSLDLLQILSSEKFERTHAAEDGLTFGCLSSDSRRVCLGFSLGFAVRGTKAVYHESPSYILGGRIGRNSSLACQPENHQSPNTVEDGASMVG